MNARTPENTVQKQQSAEEERARRILGAVPSFLMRRADNGQRNVAAFLREGLAVVPGVGSFVRRIKLRHEIADQQGIPVKQVRLP